MRTPATRAEEADPCPARRVEVPVLVYHAITDTPGRHIAPFAISPAVFKQQLDLLLAAGYDCITFSELLRRRQTRDLEVHAGGAGDRPSAVITFDDGYADFVTTALPALQARSLDCTLFVTTGWLEGRSRCWPRPEDSMLSWSELPELQTAGVEVGAHSHSHVHLDTLSTTELSDELSRPRDLLEAALGAPVASLAYPHGYNGPRVRRMTQRAGYESAAAVGSRLSPVDEDRFRISRLMVRRDMTLSEFSASLDGGDGRTRRGESWATRGWRAYRRTRAVVQGRPGSDYR